MIKGGRTSRCAHLFYVRFIVFHVQCGSMMSLLLPLIGRTMRVDAYPGCRLTPFALPWAMHSLGFQPVTPR